MIKPTLVNIEHIERTIRHGCGDYTITLHFGKVAHPAQQAIGNTRRTACTLKAPYVSPRMLDSFAQLLAAEGK
jgi:hypothetical protein